MSELAKVESNDIAPVDAFTSMVERVMFDGNADVNKLEKILDAQERILNRNAKQAFYADFAAMQNELPSIAKDKNASFNSKAGNTSYSWASLEAINDAVRPTLQKYGFGISHRVEQVNQIKVRGILLHKMGHYEETEIILPADASGSKNAVQGVGSTISYGRRYVTCSLLNISTGDDVDGHSSDTSVDTKYLDRLIKHNFAVRDNLDTIIAVKSALRAEEWDTAAEAMRELDDETRIAIGLASTKGGIFDLEESKLFKTDEYQQAVRRYFEDK